MTRAAISKAARRALQAIADHGPIALCPGVRHAEINSHGCHVNAKTEFLLRANGLVEWAGGEASRWHVRITDYGRECLERGSRDLCRPAADVASSYGPHP